MCQTLHRKLWEHGEPGTLHFVPIEPTDDQGRQLLSKNVELRVRGGAGSSRHHFSLYPSWRRWHHCHSTVSVSTQLLWHAREVPGTWLATAPPQPCALQSSWALACICVCACMCVCVCVCIHGHIFQEFLSTLQNNDVSTIKIESLSVAICHQIFTRTFGWAQV
jgi:hypothetical protein